MNNYSLVPKSTLFKFFLTLLTKPLTSHGNSANNIK